MLCQVFGVNGINIKVFIFFVICKNSEIIKLRWLPSPRYRPYSSLPLKSLFLPLSATCFFPFLLLGIKAYPSRTCIFQSARVPSAVEHAVTNKETKQKETIFVVACSIDIYSSIGVVLPVDQKLEKGETNQL